MLNSQLDANGNLIEAVAHVSKETLKLFPQKELIETRNGVHVWRVSFKGIHIPVTEQPKRQKHVGGDRKYINS